MTEAEKERIVNRLQELEDEDRIDAVQAKATNDSLRRATLLGRADAFALARDVVHGVAF